MVDGQGMERERVRLEVLAATGLLDSPPERAFDVLVELASRLTGCKYAAVSLIDRDRQWFKAVHGLTVRETPRGQAFCAVAVDQDAMLVVPDATRDPRFRANPLVTSAPNIRFYAGMPLHARARPDQPEVPLGTLCVVDDSPRELSPADLALLNDLAHIAETLIRPRFVALQAADLMLKHRLNIRDLERSHRQFHQAERMTGIGSWRLSLPDNRLKWSDGVFAIHGLPVGPVPSLDAALEYYPAQSRALLTAALERTIADGKPYDLELDFIARNREPRRVRVICEPEEVNGELVALIGVFQDITERHEMEQALRRSATVDDLTGIANRAGFNTMLDARMEQARVTGEPLALLLIDLDGFKAVNDRCGHLAGDEVLQAIAGRLKRPHLSGCCAARLGGDEFVLLLDHPSDSTAFHATVEALLAELCQRVPHKDGDLAVSGTIGISVFDGASSRRDLLNRADQALYAAKRDQRGTARIFGGNFVFGPATPACVRHGDGVHERLHAVSHAG